jgi:hypothetical protein
MDIEKGVRRFEDFGEVAAFGNNYDPKLQILM